ncbi:hypothetical protein [Actinophytocola sediminis]
MEPSEQPSGTMIVRAWLEDGRPDRLRVRILSSIGGQQAPPLAVSTVVAVQAAVLDWLAELQNYSENSP